MDKIKLETRIKNKISDKMKDTNGWKHTTQSNYDKGTFISEAHYLA